MCDGEKDKLYIQCCSGHGKGILMVIFNKNKIIVLHFRVYHHVIYVTSFDKTPPMDCTTCDEDRVYWTATGMLRPVEVSRTVADMTAEAR